MASYTMELREIIEMYTQDEENLSTRERIEKARTKLFDFDYPIFDTNYKAVFETHFIRNFYMREIGFETEGLFKFHLENWLLVNMPYFNKLFESELIKFDPLENSQMTSTHTTNKGKDQNIDTSSDGTNTGTSSNTSNGSVTDDNFNRQIDSKTPDGRLNLTANDGQGVIEYANEIVENNENNKSTSTATATGNTSNTNKVSGTTSATITETEDFIQSRTGKVGVQTYSKMLTEYRQSLLRIENKIFDDTQKLFMLVY